MSQRSIAPLLLIVAALFGTCETVLIRLIGEQLSLGQILMFRAGAQVLLVSLLAGVLTGNGLAMMRTKRIWGHLSRGALASVAWWCGFMSFRLLELPLATTLSFSSQLFLLLLAWPMLGERVTRSRIAATLLGLAGVLVALEMWRPGGIDWRVSYGLTSAFLGAIMTILTRSLTFTERTETIMFYMAGVVFLSAVPQAVVTWVPFQPRTIALMTLLALSGTMATYFFVEAYRRAEASALAPYPYSRFIFAAIFGYLLFADPIRPATLVGAVLIALGNLLPVMVARRSKRRAPDDTNAPG